VNVKGLQMMLKALGIGITPEQVAQLEIVLPQIPGKAAELITIFNAKIKLYDAAFQSIVSELEALKNQNAEQLKILEELRGKRKSN
jgi:hypothetical protein